MTDFGHIYGMIDHLIEAMEDSNIDPSVISLIFDCKEALEDYARDLEPEDE